MKSCGIEVQVFDYLETNANENERKEGYDIADYLLKVKPDEAILQQMIRNEDSDFEQREEKSRLFYWSKLMSVYYIRRPLAPQKSLRRRLPRWSQIIHLKTDSNGKEIYNNTPSIIQATRMAWCALQTEQTDSKRSYPFTHRERFGT